MHAAKWFSAPSSAYPIVIVVVDIKADEMDARH
jgi:hypothetical protein